MPSGTSAGSSPFHRYGSVTVPFNELHVTTVDERCGTAARHFLLATHEQVDRESPLRVISDIPAVRARPGLFGSDFATRTHCRLMKWSLYWNSDP